jgi:NADPH-dependent glutamate synthase beta subunit-like oxidoreductase
VKVDENGWVIHDSAGRTTVAGAWVIGNAADPRAQVITAAGQGSAAAIALNTDLVDEDVNRSLAESRSRLATSLPRISTPAPHS